MNPFCRIGIIVVMTNRHRYILPEGGPQVFYQYRKGEDFFELILCYLLHRTKIPRPRCPVYVSVVEVSAWIVMAYLVVCLNGLI